MFPLNEIIRYEPVVSDVSYEELIYTVNKLERSGNAVTLTPFEVFNPTL